MKKKFIGKLSILVLLLLVMLSGNVYAVLSRDEFERNVIQTYNVVDNIMGLTFYKDYFEDGFLQSNAYLNNISDLHFDQYDSFLIRQGNSDKVTLLMWNTNVTWYVDANGRIINNTDLVCSMSNWSCDRRYMTFSYTGTETTTYTANYQYFISTPNTTNFTCIFTNSSIANQYNYRIYGLQMTASTPVYNGSTTIDSGQYYRLCQGFIGQYYYDNYSLLDYKILKNDTQEYIGVKNIYYTPSVNGSTVDIYIYGEPSLDQVGLKVVLYYNNTILYDENEYNILYISSSSSSGDSGGGSSGGSTDLTQTNNLISAAIVTIASGNQEIINTIRSGDQNIIDSILDDSEIGSILGSLYSSGDNISDIVNEFNYIKFDNPYHNLIFGTINSFCNSLYSSGDAYLDINIRGTTRRVYSSDFNVPNNALKTFISSFLIFGIIFVLYNNFRKNIDSLSSGDAKKVLDNVEVDTNFINM